jgi:hypothetical protein
MIYAGIDYSLTSPSICIYNSSLGDFKFDRCMIYFLSDVKKLQTLFLGNVRGESFEDYNHECQRYDTISDWAIQYLIGCTMVVSTSAGVVGKMSGFALGLRLLGTLS